MTIGRNTDQPRILVLGASGRLGTMLQRHWSAPDLFPIWQYRTAPQQPQPFGQIIISDPVAAPPKLSPVDVVVSLAGIVPGKGALAFNRDLGLAAINCAIALQARHVFVASSAAVYGGSDARFCENSVIAPQSAYGIAKQQMENTALKHAQDHGLHATMLRIGNVAGADALLGQSGTARTLDRFASGAGPVRSYIGPQGFSAVITGLIHCACSGMALPDRLNVALQGGVAMADLCKAAGLTVTWQPAPPTALETVVLDVARLSALMPVGLADADAIIADWRADAAA